MKQFGDKWHLLSIIDMTPVVGVIKLFFEDIQISSKLRKWNKFVLMSEPTQKCETNAIFKQNLTETLIISFKIAYSCFFSLKENLNFLDFLQKV